ncbi:MAG TPA: hypothetical protein P5556_04570 [Candidatus Gastranaerophilales bacterium]|nr:hypothetical protein [Candidatus Gastranaerophilales bacterium]
MVNPIHGALTGSPPPLRTDTTGGLALFQRRNDLTIASTGPSVGELLLGGASSGGETSGSCACGSSGGGNTVAVA